MTAIQSFPSERLSDYFIMLCLIHVVLILDHVVVFNIDETLELKFALEHPPGFGAECSQAILTLVGGCDA